jgi:hypothetical protein
VGSQLPGQPKKRNKILMDEFRVFRTPAAVTRTGVLSDQLLSTPTRAANLEYLEMDPFIFTAEISSNRIDSYFTHMMSSTLRNFAHDALEGVSFLDSHESKRLGFGYSLAGKFIEEGEIQKTLADIYTVPGVNFGGNHSYSSTNDFILAVKAGLVRDVSVGFYGGRFTCDLCKLDYFSWDCPHIAGVEYELNEEEGSQKNIIATVAIHDAMLSEISAVYDGATPGAAILKAQQELEHGRLKESDRNLLESRYRVSLRDVNKIYAPGRPERGKNKMEEDVNEMEEIEAESAPEDLQVELGAGPEGTAAEAVVELEAEDLQLETAADLDGEDTEDLDAGEMARVRFVMAQAGAKDVRDLGDMIVDLRSEVERLRPLADLGTAYKADLIEQAIEEGIRAQGEIFPAETYRGMLEVATIDAIKTIRDQFRKTAGERFPGGRVTEVIKEKEGSPVEVDRTPDRAYA